LRAALYLETTTGPFGSPKIFFILLKEGKTFEVGA